MHSWPIDISFENGSHVKLRAFDEDLTLRRIHPTTLTYTFGERTTRRQGEPESTRLVAIAPNADIVRFAPTLGERALLVFPKTKFLCPAGLELRTVFQIPVHLHIGVGTSSDIRLVEDLAPPTITRALYGPVDSGTICTSVRTRTAADIASYLAHEPDENEAKIPEFHFGNEPDQAPHNEETPTQTVRTSKVNKLFAYASVKITNVTNEPLEVSKIMIPNNALSLYQTDKYLLCNEIQMRLLSRLEAEITPGDCPDPSAKAVDQGQGRFAIVDRRPHIFAYAYRSKTGLDYGF